MMNWFHRHRVYEKVLKARRIIQSCVTYDQLESAERMRDNFISQLPEGDDKHIINCILIAEYGKRLSQISINEIYGFQK